MRIAISADTSIDLTKELIEENDVHTIPFEILLGDKQGYDGEITCDEIISFVEKNPYELNLYLGSLYFVSEIRPKLKKESTI